MYFMNIVKELSIQSRFLTLLNQNKLVVNLISGNFEPMGIKLRNIKLKVSLINVLIKVKWCLLYEKLSLINEFINMQKNGNHILPFLSPL